MTNTERAQRGAFTLVEVLMVVSIVALLVAILAPSLNRARELAKRAACASNLHTVGQGAHSYAAANETMFPTFQDNGSEVDHVGLDYDVADEALSGSTQGNSRGWFKLVKGDYCPLRAFRCPSDELVTDKDYGINGVHDFRSFVRKAPLSYALQVTKTWGDEADPDGFSISLEESNDLVIASDRNGLFKWDDLTDNYATIIRDNDVKFLAPDMNSPNHGRNGQNVLRLSGSVKFSETPLCGINDDNIFTEANGTELGENTNTPEVTDLSDSVLMP